MADAPSGGGGWSAVEVIVALVLGIGLITTLTGGTIKPIFDTPDTAKKSSVKTTSSAGTTTGCTMSVSSPKAKAKIDTSIDVRGTFPECISSSSIPDTLYAQVVDSKGTLLSAYTTIPVNKGFFGLGASSFSMNIPLSGAAQSTTGFLILTTPNTAGGTATTTRIAIQFIPGASISAPNGSTGGSYFIANPNTQTTTYTNTTTTNTNSTTPQYTAPVQNNPAPSTGSSGGTTF